jgi:hypothetical protein
LKRIIPIGHKDNVTVALVEEYGRRQISVAVQRSNWTEIYNLSREEATIVQAYLEKAIEDFKLLDSPQSLDQSIVE